LNRNKKPWNRLLILGDNYFKKLLELIKGKGNDKET